MLNTLSIWVGFHLQQIVLLLPTYLEDSKQVIRDLKGKRLPKYLYLFTADATLIYTNIDTSNSLSIFKKWFEEFKKDLPKVFLAKLIIKALELIMKFNLFTFENTKWLQLIGTAMGTSFSYMYVMFYYGHREQKTLLPRFKTFFAYLKYFIDYIIGIWLGTCEEFEDFIQALNRFGVLNWTCSISKVQKIFMDLK